MPAHAAHLRTQKHIHAHTPSHLLAVPIGCITPNPNPFPGPSPKVRGYKTVVKFFPHEAADLETVVNVVVLLQRTPVVDAEQVG